MALPQTLEPNERGTALHDDKGNFLGYENIVTLTDGELAEEVEGEEVKLIIEQLPDKGINKAWKRLIKKGILP